MQPQGRSEDIGKEPRRWDHPEKGVPLLFAILSKPDAKMKKKTSPKQTPPKAGTAETEYVMIKQRDNALAMSRLTSDEI